MLTALQLQPPLWEVPWEHHCWNSGEEGLHSLIFPDRIQGSLSGREKGLCWAHPRTRGSYGCTKARRACCLCCPGHGSRAGRLVMPTLHYSLWPHLLIAKTEKSRKRRPTPTSQDALAEKHRLTRAWALHFFFSISKFKKKFQSTILIHRLQTPFSGPQTGDRNKSFYQNLLQECWCVRELKKSFQLTKLCG